MLLIITPNPALDRTMVVPNLTLGHRHRAERVLVAAGGKGLNVARAVHTLHYPHMVCAPLGGLAGQLLAHLAREEGITCRWSWHSAGETRTCILVVDPHAEDATPLDEHGPLLNHEDWLSFIDTIMEQASNAGLAAICGSLPPGIPSENLTQLIHKLHTLGCPAIVDTSGKALVAAIEARPYAIKVNQEELAFILDRPLETLEDVQAAITALHAQGIPLVIVSLGEDGVIAVNEQGVFHVRPPDIASVSTVGSGDSLLAGIATGLLQGFTLEQALQRGVACGAADALTIGGGLIDVDQVETLQQQTMVEQRA